MNPMNLLQLKPALDRFKGNHPKLLKFIRAAARDGVVDEGTLVEITITTTAGQTLSSNIRVQQSDLEFLKGLTDMMED